MAGPRHLRDHHPVTLAAHPGRVGLQEAERGREIQRPPPPATVALIVSRAAPPAMRAAINLPRTRTDRHTNTAPGSSNSTCSITVRRSPSSCFHTLSGRTSPRSLHIGPAVRSQNRRSPAACALSCPEVGRSQRPDLIAKQRGRRRLSSSANPATSSENVSRATLGRHALLDQTPTAALPAPAFTSPTERAGEPKIACRHLSARRPSGSYPISALGGSSHSRRRR
jgi:hypothetical protein